MARSPRRAMFETQEEPGVLAGVVIDVEEGPVVEGFSDDGLGGLLEVLASDVLGDLSPALSHDANLKDQLGFELSGFISELLSSVDDDLSSRDEWEKRYVDGLRLLGIEPDERQVPWPGASGVYHTVLTESVVAFQSNASMEMCPPSGPAKSRIVGEVTTAKQKQARRVADEINYQITEKMSDWRAEMEQVLFQLPLAGVVVKKTYFDPLTQRPCSKRIPAQDFIVHNSAAGMSAPRFTHRQRMFKAEVERLQAAGFYADDVDLRGSTLLSPDQMTQAERETIGVSSVAPEDDRVMVYECHVLHAFDALGDDRPRPYIVTFLPDTSEVLAVRRNWSEDDPLEERRSYFTKYSYFPGFGWYDYGLIHLIGGGVEAATSLLRQLIDSGTLSNVPSGFKANTFRIKGDDAPLRPGEFRDVDVPGQNIRDSLLPLPYKEPSAVLFQLLGNVVDEVRRVASVSEMKISEANSQAPVGTTLALLERSLRVMTAVHARLHESLRHELRLIRNIIRDYMPPVYEYDGDLGYNRSEDFSVVEIIPVSDPNAASQAQRVITYTGAVQIASQAPPGTYDMSRLHRGFVQALGLPDAELIVPMADDVRPLDPIGEGIAILTQKPVRAFLQQDHEAHIRVHMAMIQDPKIQAMVGQSQAANAIGAAMDAHIREHLAFAYRKRIEMELGVPLPPPDEELDDQTEALIANLSAQAAEQLLQKNLAEAQAQQAQQQMQDPVTQMKMQELQLKGQELQLKAQDMALDNQIERERLALKEREIQARLQIADSNVTSRERTAGAKMAMDAATKARINANRVRKNQE